MIWYKRHIGDYQRKTGHLSMLEHGAYTLALDAFYVTGAPLPRDAKRLFRLLRIVTQLERRAVLKVLAEFWEETPQGYVNKRAAEELLRAQTQGDINRSIANRRENRREPLHEPSNEPSHEPSTNPDTRYQIPDTRDRTARGSVTPKSKPARPALPPPLTTARLCPPRKKHAWCDGRMHVPGFVHEEFQRTAPADFDLMGWYATVDLAWSDEPIGDDAPTFWRARWREEHGTTQQTDAQIRRQAQRKEDRESEQPL